MVSKEIYIQADTSKVWSMISAPENMSRWLGESDTVVHTSWVVGEPIAIRGNLHGLIFDHQGVVLAFEPGRRLRYEYRTRLFDPEGLPESQSEIEMRVEAWENGTRLTIRQQTFADEATWRHADLYWNVTAKMIRRLCEEKLVNSPGRGT